MLSKQMKNVQRISLKLLEAIVVPVPIIDFKATSGQALMNRITHIGHMGLTKEEK